MPLVTYHFNDRVYNQLRRKEDVINYINNDGNIYICNNFGNTLLIKACINSYTIETIKLLAKKIDINKENIFGSTALSYAVERCNFGAINWIREQM